MVAYGVYVEFRCSILKNTYYIDKVMEHEMVIGAYI